MGTVERKVGSGRRRSARTTQNIDAVEDLIISQEDKPRTHRSTRQIARETGVSQSSVVRIVNKDLLLKCFKRRRAQELTESNRLARLVWSQNDRLYAARDTLKKQIAAKRLLRTRNTFSQSIMVSVGVSKLGCTELFFVDPCTKINDAYYRDILLRPKLLPRFDVFQGRILSSSRTVHLHIVRVKLWRFCVKKHQTSFLQICSLQTVQISIQLITRSGLSCSVVYTRGKSTPSTNWSRGWLKFGAAWTVDCRHGYWSVAQKT